MKNLFLSLLILFSVTLSAQTKRYKTEEFSIEYPENWKLNTEGILGTAFIIMSPVEEGDKFGESFNLIIQDLPTYDITLDDYVKISEKQIVDAFGENSILESKTENGKHKIVYTGKQKDMEMLYAQIYIIKNNKAYVLTFTCLPADYEQLKALADKTLESFMVF